MQGVIVALFIICNVILTGCGSNQLKSQATTQENAGSQQLAAQDIDPAIVATPETIAEAEPTAEFKPIATSKKSKVMPPKDATLVAAPASSSLDAATAPVPAPMPTVPLTKEISTWQPNEVHLIRGNELINGLQRDIGRKPNKAEMQQRLQSHLGLSAAQAQQLISCLGLE